MDQGLLEIVFLAFVAGFMLYRLYVTLGRRTGAERPVEPQPAQGDLPRDRAPAALAAIPGATGASGEGLRAIVRADPNFDVEQFASGARAAYELIVNAYAKGDREGLKGLLAPRVYEAYGAAIAKREQAEETGPELVRLRNSEIVGAELEGNIARVSVRFEAELAEGAHGVRDARERWTFERDVRSSDPNWLLARVTAA